MRMSILTRKKFERNKEIINQSFPAINLARLLVSSEHYITWEELIEDDQRMLESCIGVIEGK